MEPLEKLEQLAPPMSRRYQTAAMKAPTKQRSMKATNSAERRVEPRRTSVARAQAQARIDTMKRTRMKFGVNWLFSLKPLTNQACSSNG